MFGSDGVTRAVIFIMRVRKMNPKLTMREVSFFAFAEVGRDGGVSFAAPPLRSLSAATVLTVNVCSTTIVDRVVGLGNGQIKTGAPCRSEREVLLVLVVHLSCSELTCSITLRQHNTLSCIADEIKQSGGQQVYCALFFGPSHSSFASRALSSPSFVPFLLQ